MADKSGKILVQFENYVFTGNLILRVKSVGRHYEGRVPGGFYEGEVSVNGLSPNSAEVKP